MATENKKQEPILIPEATSFEHAKEIVEKKTTEEANKWLQAHYAEIPKIVENYLNKNLNQIVLKLLGFDTNWYDNHFRLDHCNGRAGNTAAGDFLIKASQKEIDKFLSEAITQLPPLSEKEAKDYRKEFLEIYHKNIKKAIEDTAIREAEAVCKKMFES